MHIVAIAAQKGGVGKTTTAVRLAEALVRSHHRVLVVDLDPQAAATALLAGDVRPSRGTAEVLLDSAALAEVVTPARSQIDLCASSDALVRAELALASLVGRESILLEALEAAPADRWDVVLLDCPPSLGLLTVNGLAAAGFVLSPVVPAYLSLISVRQLEGTVAAVQKRINPGLRSLGHLLCAVDARERLLPEAREALRQHVGLALWPIEVRVDARLKAGPSSSASRGRGAEDYARVAIELMRRLEPPLKRTSQRPLKRPAKRTSKAGA